jgi:hypothetical protein
MSIKAEFASAEQRLGNRYCSYCSLVRDAAKFTLRKGKPPMCESCTQFRAGNKRR